MTFEDFLRKEMSFVAPAKKDRFRKDRVLQIELIVKYFRDKPNSARIESYMLKTSRGLRFNTKTVANALKRIEEKDRK